MGSVFGVEALKPEDVELNESENLNEEKTSPREEDLLYEDRVHYPDLFGNKVDEETQMYLLKYSVMVQDELREASRTRNIPFQQSITFIAQMSPHSSSNDLESDAKLLIVGSHHALGFWNPSRAPEMKYFGDNLFSYCLDITDQFDADCTLEYKYVLQQNHSSGKLMYGWEDLRNNSNRHIFVQIGNDAQYRIDREVLFLERVGTICFKMHYDLPSEDEVLCITGDPIDLGSWIDPGAIEMTRGTEDEALPEGLDGFGKYWTISIARPPMLAFAYRYVVRNKKTGHERWEREPNRMFKPLKKYLSNAEECEIDPKVHPSFVVVDVNFISNLEFDLIPAAGVLLGPYPQSSGDVQKMNDAGVTAVLNVQTDDDHKHRKVHWPSMLEEYQKYSIEARRVPIEDFNPKSLERNLAEAAKTLAELRRNHDLVYVHCTAGMSRAAASTIAYMVLFTPDFETMTDAYQYVKKHRAVIAPNLVVLQHVIEEQQLAMKSLPRPKKVVESKADV
eukprot:CAMPEP_0182442468 /NCGR_PEP_ID=MMETSP1172-20130603/1379_1 /TAXON_ID=708627 /ORGANISM="Timspurckia oligopyrenoides, Strain CCMP3278" /LENGTH=504 /DNA_ID=CAMNT_0024637341 /DNA_START=47 /DNA_END=1561 /DNA_ORIENTATION=+